MVKERRVEEKRERGRERAVSCIRTAQRVHVHLLPVLDDPGGLIDTTTPNIGTNFPT